MEVLLSKFVKCLFIFVRWEFGEAVNVKMVLVSGFERRFLGLFSGVVVVDFGRFGVAREGGLEFRSVFLVFLLRSLRGFYYYFCC